MPPLIPTHCCSVLLLAALLLAPASAAPRQVEAFNTYENSPFLLGDGGGLAPELVTLLNQVLAGWLKLELRNLPRARLLQYPLKQPQRFADVVLLLNPAFIGDSERRTYLWSEPLFEDHNVLVLRADQAPVQVDLDWLLGKRLIAVRGQRLKQLAGLIADGRLQREDYNSELQTLRMVAAGRGDFTFMNNLMFQHLSREQGLQHRVVAVPVPGGEPFQRHILIGKAAPELLAPLNAAIEALHCLPAWQQTAATYGFTPLPCGKP